MPVSIVHAQKTLQSSVSKVESTDIYKNISGREDLNIRCWILSNRVY